MAEFPYTPNPANLKRFLDHVQSAGVPSKVTIQYITSAGFKSTNDRAILTVLKTLGFVDSSGVPTDTWRAYRDRDKARAVMATVLESSYSGLFSTYPDAYRRDNEALRNYFSAHTSVGEAVLSLIVRTFKTLAELADFEATPVAVPGGELTPPPAVRHEAVAPKLSAAPGLTVNINIQLQLPATENETIYEKLFASLKKHLLN
jgi:uncharacterized protein DUF5343